MQRQIEIMGPHLLRLLRVEVLLRRRRLVRHRAWVMRHWLWLRLVGRVLYGRGLHGVTLVLARRWLLLSWQWLVLHGRIWLLGWPILMGTCKALQEISKMSPSLCKKLIRHVDKSSFPSQRPLTQCQVYMCCRGLWASSGANLFCSRRIGKSGL